MEQEERLSYLENVRDWQTLAEELERGISRADQNAKKAAFHLQLGRILEKKFLAGVKALKHFQDAYKLNPALLEALAEARAIYWELGKLNMVQKLLELELKAASGSEASVLLVELGDVLGDLGDLEKATATYARALAASGGGNKEASACLEDVQAESGSWEQQVAQLLRAASEVTGAGKGRILVRAARITRRFAPGEVTAMLARAYAADPLARQTAALYEGALADAGDLARLETEQRGLLEDMTDRAARAHAALVFGTRWIARHQNTDSGAKFLEEALKLDPTHDGAFFFLRELHGKKGGDWNRVLTLAEEAMASSSGGGAGENGDATFLLAQAGTIAWREMGNLIRARSVFERLAAAHPEHPQLQAFEAQIGEQLPRGGSPKPASNGGDSPHESAPSGVPTPRAQTQNVAPTAPPPQAAPEPAPKSVEAPKPAADEGHRREAPDQGKIAELRALAEKQEGAKRFNEYVKTLLQLAAMVPEDHEKVELYMKAADLYVGKFANQAEAVKAYEAVVAIQPDNQAAIDYLRQMYEKRRDWEKLLGLQRREAEGLPQGPERAQKFLEMAKLATERVKKPDVCIELWNEVIASDDGNPDALAALSVLYERSKEFDKLATVLEKQAEITENAGQKIQILNKLGTIYGERLSNDEGAVAAWRHLLALDPNDRKAQEALKKKYLALGRWDDLEVFYAETGKWDEFIRVLEQQEAKETKPDAKIGMLFKIAELWADKKQKADRAAKAYEKVLELEPQNLRAAESLIPIYTAAGNAKLLANAIEVKLGHQENAQDRLALLREVAALYEGRVKEPAKAFERYLSAFEIAPEEEQSSADAERAAKATQGWDRLIAAYRAAIDKADGEGSRDLAVMLRLKLGRVLVAEVQRLDEALTTYRAVYEADGENADAIVALERLYRQTQSWTELLGIYEKKRDLATDGGEKKAINYEIAKLFENEVKDVDKAIATYVAVLEEEPTDMSALAALDVLYGRLERWEPYVDVLRRRIELDNEEKSLIDLKFRLGATLEQHCNDAQGALENYREILFLDAQHPGAKAALEAMLAHSELKADAAAILESIYEEAGEWNKLIGALDILAASEEDVQKRVTLRRKAARISAEAMSDYGRAFDALAAALKEDPAQNETRFEIGKIAEVSDSQKKLVALYVEIAKELSDATLARDYWMKVAAIDEQLGLVDDAAAAYTHVLELDAADADALAALEKLFVRTQRWEDLIGVIQRRIDLAAEPDARESLYMSMAQVQDERLSRPTDAVASYRKVLELDPQSSRALAALDALLVRQKMWPELAENLEAQLALTTDDAAQLSLMLRLAALRETEMNQVETAIEGYRSVLDREPNNEAALAALERLGKVPEHELAIADLLEPLYRHLGDHTKLIAVHEVQVRRAAEAERRVELLHQIAQLYEDAAGDLNQAFATYARALKEDAGNEQTQHQIERVARATARFADLAHVYEELSAALEDKTLASQLSSMAARVYEQDIADATTAIARYRRVLEIDPQNLAAAESLERLFRTAAMYPELSAILQRKSEILEEPHDKKEALFQAAAIEEDMLERPEEAIAVYKKVLDIDGEDVHALDSLIKRYLGLSNWPDLLAIYTRKADLVADPEEKKRIYYQVGAVYERELGDVPKSIDIYQKVLELDPDDLQALSRLDVLYEQAQNWQELLAIMTRESEMTADPAEAISFQYRIADLYEKRLEDVPRAIELYRDILSQQADHAPTLQALEGLKDGTREPLGAAAVLEPVYEAASDWMKLVSVHEVQVKHTEDAFQRVELLHRIARLHEDAMDNHASAFETYARAVVFDNGNADTLQNLERIATLVNRWPEVAKLYDAELDKLTENPERFVELGLRVAAIYETQLEDVDNAIGRYRRVAEVDAENQTAIRALDRLFTMTERWSDLAVILGREAEIGQTPDEILDFRYRLGQLYEQKLQDVDHAIGAYREVINAAPEHTSTVQALEALFAAGTKQLEIGEILEPLYRSAGDWDKLAQVYEAQLTHIPTEKTGEALGGQEDRLAAYYKIAELHEEKLVDAAGALEVYIRALKEYPLDERSGDDVARLAAVVDGGWDTLANAYADIVSAHESTEVQRSIGKKLARVFEDELGDITKAEETYKYVLSVEPLDTDALSNLDRIYLSLESWPELAAILEQRIKAGAEPLDLVELHSRLGEIYETRLSDTQNAIRVYRRIFDELDKTHDGAIAALGRIYTQLEAWPELLGVHERELENASGDAAEADIRAKIGHLLFEKLNQPERATETWKKVLDLRGEDSEALGALANLYEQQQVWAELVNVLERQCEAETADDQRVNILSRKARMYTEKLQRDDLALADWTRVLDIDFANLAALRAVAAIRRRAGDPTELVNALHQVVDRATAMLDIDELKEVFRELGKTYGEQLAQPFDAADAWRKLLDVGPDFEAMDALEAIYRGEEKWTDVIDVKMQRAAALEDPAQKIEEYRQVAQLWRENAQEPDKATTAWQRILEVDPAHDEAFNELEKLHTAAERWEPLVELYLARLDTRTETAEKTDLLRRIARAFEEHLDDRNQALDALLNALGEDFHDRETAKYLERMAQATGRWNEVINTANGWLKEQTDPQQKIRLCLHLAKWYGDDLGKPEYAQPYYAQIVQLDPNNVGALRQMGQLYRKSGNLQQYGHSLTKALEVAINDIDRKEIQNELGELLDGQMNQTDQAITYFQRALEVDPQFLSALENLERIYNARGLNRELVDVLTRKVAALSDPAEIATTKLRIGALYEGTLSDQQRAAQVYRETLEVDQANLQAMRGLARTCEALEQWSDLVKVLEQQLDVVTTERERIEVLMQLANIQEEHFLKSDVAAQRLEQVVEIDPSQEPAFVALERNYRKLRQWHELVQTYERHITATLEKATKVELYGYVAQVQSDEIGDADKAIEAYQNIVDLDDTNVPALDALAKLHDKRGDATQAIDYMTRVADLTQDSKQRVEMYYRIGKALDEKLGDRVAAQDRYEMALDIDPAHLPTLASLRAIAMDNADYDKVARLLDQEQANTQGGRQRARLLVELGNLRETTLGDHESAVLAWEAAVEADPENEDAALPLGNHYIERESWDKAEPLFDLLVRKAGKRERAEQHDLQNRLGQVYAALGKDDKALKAYTAAHQLDITDHVTIKGLAEVSFRLKDWGNALTNYQKVLTSLAEDEAEARAEVYYKLGCIKREQGQAKQAINNFEKALAVASAHRPTLEAMVSLYTELRDYKQVVAYKRQILDNVFEEAERYKILNEIGETWRDLDKNPNKAIEAFEEALGIQPNSHPLLHTLLALYQQVENWPKMIDTIQQIADLEKDPLRKSKFIYTMAQIYRDKENDLDRAVELFNASLDLNPQFLEAFERINKILTGQKEWKQLERNFRKMLKRMPPDAQNPDLAFNLWHSLGIIYRDRLHDMQSSIEAFKMATRYKPDEAVERQILAELFEATDQMEAAIGEHAIVLQKDPMRIDPYRSLYKLYQKLHEYDRAWCMCAALAFLQKADEEEQRFFEDYRPRGMIQVKSRLDNEQWVKNLFHKDENLFIGKIMEMITPAAIVAKTTQLRASRQLPVLDKRFKQDPGTSTVTFAKTFGWAAQVLGVPLPEIYVRSDVPGALVAVPASPPASVAGATVLTGFAPQELTFIIGKHLSYYRGEHYIKNLFPTLNELKVLLFAAVKVIVADFNVPPEMTQAVNQTAAELVKYMQPVQRDGLRMVVQRFVEDGARADLKKWMQTVEVTACRAGLLLCADMEIAKKIISAEPQLPGDLTPTEKMKELLVFSVSEQYFALRKALGIAVG